MKAQFCIQARAGIGLFDGRPHVFYRVYFGAKPPVERWWHMRPVRPAYTSTSLDDAKRWIEDYRAVEIEAAGHATGEAA